LWLEAHHLTSALQAHWPVGIDVLQDEGELDDLPEGKDALRLNEDSSHTEITRDARSVRQFHG
jgi:hypothetical protein